MGLTWGLAGARALDPRRRRERAPHLLRRPAGHERGDVAPFDLALGGGRHLRLNYVIFVRQPAPFSEAQLEHIVPALLAFERVVTPGAALGESGARDRVPTVRLPARLDGRTQRVIVANRPPVGLRSLDLLRGRPGDVPFERPLLHRWGHAPKWRTRITLPCHQVLTLALDLGDWA